MTTNTPMIVPIIPLFMFTSVPRDTKPCRRTR